MVTGGWTNSGCSVSHKGCVKWVEKYFKDCVCNLSSEVSFGLGLVSLSCWGIAEIPQIITNFQTKSGDGVSLAFLLTWVLGDVFNMVGCLLEPVTLPTQLYTALLYTATTLVLLVQTIYYDYFIGWWKNRGFQATLQVDEEKRPSKPKKDDPTTPISTTSTSALLSPQIDVHYKSARSLANSGSSPYSASSYLIGAMRPRSGPSNLTTPLHDSSSDEDEDHHQSQRWPTNPRWISPRSVGYGTLLAGVAGLPSQAKALMEMQLVLYTKNMMQETGTKDFETNPYGLILGWIMAVIYMGGRLPQIYLNIKRGNVEGLNPLMFIFALIANATYVGSILARSTEWARIKPNAPWLLDAIVCVLLDLCIIIQFAYYKLVHRRRTSHRDGCDNYLEARKPLV